MLVQSFAGNKTVLEAACDRMAFIFDSFDTIIVSVSGGKDSTVLAHLALIEAQKRSRKIGLYFLDEEVVYQGTVDQVDYLMDLFPENINKIWFQIEFNLSNATSVTDGQLLCWEAGKHKDWMRPKKPFSVKFRMWSEESQTVRDKNKGFGFYDVIENFERCYEGAAFLVGLRAAGESPNRWRAVVKNPVEVNGKTVYWGTKKGNNTALYPLYDWNFHDVWKYIHDTGIQYHRVYDMQFKKGYPINEMRVSSLIHERAFKSICDLPEFEPKTYDRLTKRIKGISMAQETGKNSKMFKCQKLPKNFKSWMKYRDFLIETHLDKERIGIFAKRFSKHLNNEYVARQQCRQLVLNDYENNLPVDSKPDPRDELLQCYKEVL